MPALSPSSRLLALRVVRAVLYVGLLALLLEGGARWALRSEAFLRRISSPYDEPSWRLRWLLRHQGGEAPYRFSFDQYHPERGWTLAANLDQAEVFDGKRLSSNSRGLRGRREFAVPKPAGVYRIALFGDSFTFGEDVSDDETFAQQLETLLPGVEILNFGVHGYGHDQMLLYLREALPIYRPDIVLVGNVTDDALRNMTRFRDFAKPRFRLLGDSTLRLEGTPVPSPQEMLARQVWHSRLGDFLTMAWTRFAWRWGGRAEELDRLTGAILTEMFREARAAGARPAIALLPVWGELGATDLAPLPGEGFAMGLAERERVPCLRLRPMFLERARFGAEFEKVGHWGPLEHRIAAGGIADFLRREGLLP